MNQSELGNLLKSLITAWENEVVEFKEARGDYKTDRIGEYFSALANEANLRGQEKAWLVFGVNDKTRFVTGTNYRPEQERLQSTKMQITEGTDPSVTFRNIYDLQLPMSDQGIARRTCANIPDDYRIIRFTDSRNHRVIMRAVIQTVECAATMLKCLNHLIGQHIHNPNRIAIC
jgi:hypothetical protein